MCRAVTDIASLTRFCLCKLCAHLASNTHFVLKHITHSLGNKSSTFTLPLSLRTSFEEVLWMMQNVNENGEFSLDKWLQLVFQQHHYILHTQSINHLSK